MSSSAKKAPSKSKKKHTTPRQFVGGLFYILFLGICLALGGIAGWLSQSSIITDTIRQKITNTTPQKVFRDDSITVLILGCDKELYYGGKQVLKQHARSDMMMVARFDFERKLVGTVSIPRDTLCKLPGYDRQKINAYNAIGGPELAKAAVEEILPEVKIDRVVTLNFDAFIEIIDMVGGLDLYIPRDMNYTDKAANLYIDLKKGRQHLDGYQAMGYVRWRKNSTGRGGDSDFERQKRQKDLLLALKSKLLLNWQVGPKVLQKTIEVGGNTFDSEEVASLAMFVQSLDSNERIRMGQIPVNEIEGTYNLSVDRRLLPQVLRQYMVVPVDDPLAMGNPDE